MTSHELETAILEVLGQPSPTDRRLGRGEHYLLKTVNDHIGVGAGIDRYQFMKAMWSLVSQGLAYIDITQPAPENWTLELTEAGEVALDDSRFVPDNVPAYLKKIAEEIPQLAKIPKSYLDEALRTYTARCYVASSMMLGVAAEAIVLDAAEAFAKWTPDGSGNALNMKLQKSTVPYVQKFEEFRKRLPPHKSNLPGELQQNLDLTLISLIDLLRVTRNSVGHPTGASVSRESAFQYLVVFPMFAKRLYILRDWCRNETPPRGTP